MATKIATAADYEKNILPDYVVPKHYELALTPNLEGDYKYRGSAAINLELRTEGLRKITLHAKELELAKCVYTAGNTEESRNIVGVASSAIIYNEEETTVDILFPDDLPIGAGTLSIDFIGKNSIPKLKPLY